MQNEELTDSGLASSIDVDAAAILCEEVIGLNDEEKELVQRFRGGDERAFDELVDRTKANIFALAYRWTRDRELAFDLVQETYIKLFKFLPDWNHSCKVETWLYRVMTNACIDYHRKNRHFHVSLDLVDDTANIELQSVATGDNPGQMLQARERMSVVEKCIASLPAKMQAAFRMKYIGGLTLKEIAEVQDCSVGTIKATIHQAIKKLRLQLCLLEKESL